MADATSDGVYAHALAYVKAGLFVNPLYVSRKPDGKKAVRPVGLWRQTSSNSTADVAAWWGEGGSHTDAGILIDCGKSGLVVVDLDGQEGYDNWTALDPPEPLWKVLTSSGGQHWYYRAHPDHVIGNDQDGKVAPSVDIRGLGGLVIAPPTGDGQSRWVGLGQVDWGAGRLVPQVVIQRMTAVEKPVDKAVDDGFDTAGRTFTREQATQWIKDARAKLGVKREKGWNGAINDFAMVCAHFPWLVDRDLCARLMIRTVGPITGWEAADREDVATIDSAYKATEVGKSWVGQEVAAADRVAESAPVVLPPPSDPMAVVRALTAGRDDLAWWRDDFYRHRGTHWERWELAQVKRWLYDKTGDAIWFKPGKEGPEPARWAPTRKRIADLVEAMGEGSFSRFGQEEKCMALVNGVLNPVTRELAEHTPARFNLNVLPFSYDPTAKAPEWEKFLESSLPNDREAHEFLGEWFGYVLSGRTDLQKICALVGPRRCGKGTSARILRAMVGEGNWCAPTLAKLGPDGFGQESMLGKSLAVMGDVRWTSKHVVDAVPMLLGISGEDGVDIGRKYQKTWSGKLGTRIMLMSNDAPAFTDASGALAGRMVYAAFEHSFYGREDHELEGRCMAELPGILNWALAGLDRLNRNGGRFTQSSRSLVLREEVDRDSSPVAAWVEDRCVLDPTAELWLESLFESYRGWLKAENASYSPTLARFSRDLQSAFRDQGVTVIRKRDGAGRHRAVTGVRPIVGGTIPPSEDPFD